MSGEMGTIVIEKLFGGWATDFTPSNGAAVEGLEDEYTKSSSGGIAVNRPGFHGHIQPAYAFDAITDTGTQIASLPVGAAANSNGQFYAITQGTASVSAAIIPFTSSGTSTKHSISASTGPTVGYDIMSFISANGNEFNFYAYNRISASGDVGRISAVTGAPVYDDNYWNTTATTRTGGSTLTFGVPHFLTLGVDGIIYCTNGQYLASFDPTIDAVNYQALDTKSGYINNAIATFGNYIVTAAYRNTTAGATPVYSEAILFLWDGFSPTYNFQYNIGDNYVGALYTDGENLYAITQGRNYTTKLKVFTGTGFQTVDERATSTIGGAPIHTGVSTHIGHVTWGASAGNFNQYGSPNHQKFRQGFHHAGALSNIGMVRGLEGSSQQLYVGDANGSTYTIQKLNTAEYATGVIWKSRLLTIPYRSNIRKIKLYFSQFGTGASIKVALFKDYITTAIGGANDLINKTLTNATLGAVSTTHIDTMIPDVSAFYLVIQFNHASITNTAAIIRKIEIDYELTNQP